jgi:hypothetical protein
MALKGPQCAGVGLAPSGLTAITTTLLSVLSAGDHVLVTDYVYRPTRNFCNGMLARQGVETTYFDPRIGARIESLFKPNPKAACCLALSGLAGVHHRPPPPPDFCGRAANHPFTMTVNPAVRSTKNFTPQVPLYL